MEEKERVTLKSPLQLKTWSPASFTATTALIVVAIALVVHKGGSTEIADLVAGTVAGAAAGAAAGAGVGILQSLWREEAKKVTTVTGVVAAVAGAVAGGAAGIAAAILGSSVGAQSHFGSSLAGAMTGAATVTVARPQLQWLTDTILWAIDKIQLLQKIIKVAKKVAVVLGVLGIIVAARKLVNAIAGTIIAIAVGIKALATAVTGAAISAVAAAGVSALAATGAAISAVAAAGVSALAATGASISALSAAAGSALSVVAAAAISAAGVAAISTAAAAISAVAEGIVAAGKGIISFFQRLFRGKTKKRKTQATDPVKDESPDKDESQDTDETQETGKSLQTCRSSHEDKSSQTDESFTKKASETEQSPSLPGQNIKDFLKILGLAECYDKKLTLHTVLQIDRKSVTDMQLQSLLDLPWIFLKRLMMLQKTARSIKYFTSDQAEDSDWDNDEDGDESYCPLSVNPLDIVTAVLLCSDSFLQQEIILKMSMCQFAVPLLLPNNDNNQITLMLWAMRDIVKKYRPHSLSDSNRFVEERIALSDLPLVSFVRLGRCNISKSEILNKLLSNPQQYTDTFVHFKMDCGNIKKKISNGLVELSWYLPCGNKNIDVFPEPVAIANLRGDIQNFETQYSFLCEASAAVFVFFESQLLDTKFISVPSQKSAPQFFFVANSNNESIKATVKKLNLKKSNFIFKAKQTDSDFLDKIQNKLQDVINNNNHKTSVVHLAEIAQNLGILVDENAEECQRAKKRADEITSKIKDIVQFKKKELPLQGEILMKLAELEKEECRMKKLGESSFEDYKSDLLMQKKKLRQAQYRLNMSSTMSCFISAISTPERAYFLKWLRINLENNSHKILPKLKELYKQKCHDACGNKMEIPKLDEKISISSLGVEHFIREMSQLYEAAVSLPEDSPDRKQLEHLPRLCAQLLLDGFSLELLDGDSSYIPVKWITGVFSELNTLVGSKNKIVVVTVLGVQGSGKSTLLNTMFGVQFAVSSGRCTRGAFMQLVKVTEDSKLSCDYIVIIDTEGLKSPELAKLDNSYEHDNELATLVVGLSDVAIVNIAMENSTEMKDILQIIVHAFFRMEKIGKKHKCLFVHQNVADVSAHDSNMRDRKLLLEQLDEMTQAAAKMENKLEFSKFTDVMNYNTETDDHYIPGLWHGNPPMAPVSVGYSESVYALKKHIMEIFRCHKPSDIKEFLQWTKDLWTAVKYEKFIFSFRNSLVADAYMKLSTEYNRWDWTLRKEMHTWALEAETKILNHGKFENSERSTIEDVHYHLLQEAETKLSKGQDEIIHKIESYFEQGEGHVELVENFRQEFINSAKSLKAELLNSIQRKLNAALYQETAKSLQTCRSSHEDKSSQKDESFAKKASGTEQSPSLPGQNIKDFLKILGLAECYDKELTLHTVLQIDKKSVTDLQVQSLLDLPWIFLKRLMMLQRTVRSIKYFTSDQAEDSDWDNDEDGDESYCSQSVNPLDVVTAVLLCSDSFLQQEIILKMSMCQLAVPLLLPNNNQITLMLWAMRDIVKKYRPHSLSDSNRFVEERIALSDLPLVSFVRLGRCNISKSEILNKLLSNPQQYTDTFVHFNMDCGNITKKISNGLVELTWYLPCGNKNIDVFPEPVAIANLRGDIQNFETQYSFLCEASAAVFVFFESQLLDTKLISVPSQKSVPQLFFVGNSNNESIKATVKKLNLKKSNFIFKAKQNDADFVDKIQTKLQDAIHDNNHKTSVVHLAEIAQNLGILVDENAEECQRAKKSANEITSNIKDIVQFKKKELPLQGEILMKLAMLEKEECRMKKLGEKSVEDYKNDLQIQKNKLRQEQCRLNMSSTMNCFISAVSTPERAYFLKWLRINLENRSHEVFPELREQYKQKCQDALGNEMEISEMDKKISNSSLGVEHFIREMSQLYEAAVSLPEDSPDRKQLEHLPRLCAQLLLDGFSLELVDGDSSYIPVKWITGVFSELNSLVGTKNKIVVVTVLGVQGLGKSTLLNTLFGVQFAVSSGRCTRGAFMQLIKVTEDCELSCDYIVIIDTEGLKSPELAKLDNSYEHDNELATLVVGLSDVAIVNIAMDNSTEVKDILQIIVHAFLRMKEIGKKHKCLFVHQNVADVSAHDSNMRDRKLLLEQLDEMTQAATKMENKLEFSKFTDVMNYNTETDDHYIPGLWHGNPPMAPVSVGYSESVYALKKHIMEIFRCYYPSDINEFVKWTKDLWTAVKYEKFIFSFRNSLVADAYIKLCTEYNRWDWTLRKKMQTWALEAETKILNHGKFENSERSTIEDVHYHLLQEAETELLKGQDEIIHKIESYYEQGEGHVELVENYRQEFINSAKSLKVELLNSIQRKLDVALSCRNKMIKVEGIKKTYMDTVENKVLSLLNNCREKRADKSDLMLDKAFENMWEEMVWIFTCTEPQRQDIDASVRQFLRANLKSRVSSVAQCLVKEKNFNNQGSNHSFVREGKRFYQDITDQTKSGEEFSQKIFWDCRKFVEEKREQNYDYNDTCIMEILNMIDEKLTAHEDLKDFELFLKVDICDFASREFQKLHNQFIQENDPLAALENFKQTYRSDFIDLYQEQDQSQKKADEFVRNCLKPALERYISKRLGTEMADNMVTGENSDIFESRTSFQISALKKLLDEFEFEKYVRFINLHELFVEDLISDEVQKHFSAQNRMCELEEKLLSAVISEITQAIQDAEKDSEKNGIKELIENICQKLEKKLVFAKNAVDKISTLNNANKKQFTECLHCSVNDMYTFLKAGFEEKDVKSKIDDLQTKPQDVLFNRVHGCGKQCPFCKAPCEAGGEAHTKHFVSIHRPIGLVRCSRSEPKKLVTDICTSLVYSDATFKCQDTNDQWHPYKEYSKIYQDWQIDPDPSIDASLYWKYVMARFNLYFALEYDAEPADIPSHWKNITKAQALESLK